MYPQMVYHADVRAREKAQAARDREMGCSSCAPLGRMISRFIMKCNGREGRVRYDERMGMDYAMAYAPAQTCYVRPTSARTVTLAATTSHHPTNAHVHADHPDPHPPRAQATTTTLPPGTPSSFAPAGAPAQRKPRKKKKKHVRFTPAGAPVPAGAGAPPQDTAMAAGGRTAAATVYHHHGAPADASYSPAPPAHGGGHGGHHGYAYGYGRYAPSPLPRWEMLGTPRRPEYFSSEYRWYYPTPVREGIYSIATDANGRLTTIFSEENPNACTIV